MRCETLKPHYNRHRRATIAGVSILFHLLSLSSSYLFTLFIYLSRKTLRSSHTLVILQVESHEIAHDSRTQCQIIPHRQLQAAVKTSKKQGRNVLNLRSQTIQNDRGIQSPITQNSGRYCQSLQRDQFVRNDQTALDAWCTRRSLRLSFHGMLIIQIMAMDLHREMALLRRLPRH